MHPDTDTALSSGDINTLCQQYLTMIYQEINTSTANEGNSISQTGGEILYPSIDKLIAKLPLTENDVFVDLGSGLGKVLIYFFLKTGVKEARGIEIIPAAYECSLLAAQRVERELPEFFINGRKLVLIQGDFLKFSLVDATVIFLCSVCFEPGLLSAIGEIINNTPSIHTVLTLRPIINLQRLRFYKAVNIECSWSSALCYIYRDF